MIAALSLADPLRRPLAGRPASSVVEIAGADSKMDAGAEADMPIRLSLQIEPFRMKIRLRVRQHHHDLVAASQPGAAEFDVSGHATRP